MKRLVDWDEYHLFLKDIHLFIFSPFRHTFDTFAFQCCVKVRSEEMNLRAIVMARNPVMVKKKV